MAEAQTVADKLKAAKARAAAGSNRPKPRSYTLADNDSAPPKVMIYAHSGCGKTYFIIGLLLYGERVFVLSTDFGSNGLATVKNALKKMARFYDPATEQWTAAGNEILSRVRAIDLATYRDIVDFLDNPVEFVPDLDEWAPTVFMWEGFTTFNVDILDEHILSFAPGAENAGDLRYEGFTHTKQDWQGMKRGTVRPVRKFMALTLPNGKPMAKILTALESGGAEINSLTQKAEKTALVHGTGRALMGPAFDVILEAFKTTKDNETKYFYRCEGDSDKYLVKSRGYDLKPIEDADPERVWRRIRAAGGGAGDRQKEAA
jgi:hypothetical protein